jgi:hypothetical protein
MKALTASARLAMNKAQQLAQQVNGYVELIDLLLGWGDLSYVDTSIGSVFSDPTIFPGRSTLSNDRRQSAQGTFRRLRSIGIDPAGLLRRALEFSADEESPVACESHLVRALAEGRETQLESLGFHVTLAIERLQSTETRGLARNANEIYEPGQQYRAISAILKLIRSAESRVTLVDNYIDARVLDLFTEKQPPIGVRILTRAMTPALARAAQAFVREFGDLAIRLTDQFHDRFLIIDDSRVYHLGASVKNMGAKTFRISEIESVEESRRIIGPVASAWDASAAS